MIVANLKEATNINEYQISLKQQLQKAHGEQYTDYLDEIARLTKNVQSYREIGTFVVPIYSNDEYDPIY